MLLFQDPSNLSSTSLLETLLSSFEGAKKIGAAFAFVSSAGVRLITNDESFRRHIQNQTMRVVVGMDAVTNRTAIDSLRAVAEEFPNFQVQAFINHRPGAIFHPKFCWIQHSKGGRVVTGSGNLTAGGLLRNWEAYYVADVESDRFEELATGWDTWLNHNRDNLRELDNADVIRAADRNSALAIDGDLPELDAGHSQCPSDFVEAGWNDDQLPDLISEEAHVLIAEIPKTRGRIGQANFHKSDYENFFGVQEGRPGLCVFGQVNESGTEIDWEHNRKSIAAKSKNFRFELKGMLRTNPEVEKYPIGIFITIGVRAFIYRVFQPGDADYDDANALLRPLGALSSRRYMRTTDLKATELLEAWPEAPFWNLPSEFTDGIQ